MIIVCQIISVAHENADELRAALRAMSERMSLADGCVDCLCVENAGPGQAAFVERWTTSDSRNRFWCCRGVEGLRGAITPHLIALSTTHDHPEERPEAIAKRI